MKKTPLILLFLSILFFTFSRNENRNIEIKNLKPLNKESILENKSLVEVKKEGNSSLINKKPIVYVFGSMVATIEEKINLSSSVVDGGKIVSYMWKEGNRILGSKENLFTFFSVGEHLVTLVVKDNRGEKVEASITINIYEKYDKKEYRLYQRHSCVGTKDDPFYENITYTFYNEEGNITRKVNQKDTVTISEYSYDDEGHLLSESSKTIIAFLNIEKYRHTLYDKVGNIVEYSYSHDSESKHTYENVKLTYNTENQPLEEVSRDKNNVVYKRINHTYNQQGKETRETTEYYSGEDALLSGKNEIINSYNEKGSLLSTIDIENGTSRNGRYYQYDNREEIVRIDIDDDGDGESDMYEIYTYNENSQNILTKRDDGDGVLRVLTLSKYNENGQKILHKQDYDGDGELESVIISEYNDNGKKINSRVEENGIVNAYTKYEYNLEGKMVEEREDRSGNGEFDSTVKYAYNQNGKKIEELIDNDGDGNFESYNYYTDSGKIKKYKYYNLVITYFYDENDELIREVNENGKVLYFVESNR